MPRKKSRPMRLPNGFGSVVKLSGSRRNPYMARPPIKEYQLNGQPVVPKAIGYFPDWYTAYDALVEYNRSPYDVDTRALTFAEVYEKMLAERMSSQKPPSRSTIYAYREAFQHLSQLHNVRMMDLRLDHLQSALDNSGLRYSMQVHVLNLMHQVYKYALKYDIVEKDYSHYTQINIVNDNEKGVPFTEEEIDRIWNEEGDPTADLLLILIYSGFRIGAIKTLKIDLEKGYFQGGVKTRASKNRIVPIHPLIRPAVIRLLKVNSGQLLPQSTVIFRKQMRELLERMNIPTTHTPHDCRHTFSWLCDKYGVDMFTKKVLMGHSLGTSVTENTYGHRNLEELRAEIERICH